MKDLFSFLKPVHVRGKVRLGNDFDGGYVVYANILVDTDVLVSYGVGWDTTFEEEFNQITQKRVLMFDPTMYKNNPLDGDKLRRMFSKFKIKQAYDYIRAARQWGRLIKYLSSREVFFIAEGISNVSKGVYYTFSNHKERFSLSNGQLLLKIDIEGAEYSIFSDSNFYLLLQNVNQIIIEFHDLKNRYFEFKRIVRNLKSEYEIVHIHCNNYSDMFTMYDFKNEGRDNVNFSDVLEITFVRKDKIDENDLLDAKEIYPIKGLDFPNDPSKGEHILSFLVAD